ncbi:hypothetical protein BCR39DRAFT_514763 [Naematelia encephala]|uniref:Telomere replication protein EST3 n=1 Tax=Naematelia encephala TaxID=71784 RepID=A0A1Y2BJ31_9TREE|nr:hypothetical protein BCR39DRAFT_514763 [Naematelia encephala]
MAESLGSWIARAVIQHDQKYGANLTVHWTGQRLCQLIGFDTYRTPEVPHNQILGRISDQTHWIHVRFDVAATDEHEKPIPGMQAETLTSHLRSIFLIKRFKLRLSAPPGDRQALPRLELDILEWDVYDGDRHDPVFWENAVAVSTGKDGSLIQKIIAKWWIGESYSDPSQQSPEAGPSTRRNVSTPKSETGDYVTFEDFLEPYINPPDGRKTKPIPEYIFEVHAEAKRELEQITVFRLNLDHTINDMMTEADKEDEKVNSETGKADNDDTNFMKPEQLARPDSPPTDKSYTGSSPRLTASVQQRAVSPNASDSDDDMPIRQRGRPAPRRRDMVDPLFFADSPGILHQVVDGSPSSPAHPTRVSVVASQRRSSDAHNDISMSSNLQQSDDALEGEEDEDGLSDYERDHRRRAKAARSSSSSDYLEQIAAKEVSPEVAVNVRVGQEPLNESLGESQPAEDFSLSRYADQPSLSASQHSLLNDDKQSKILVDNSDESHNKLQQTPPSQSDPHSQSVLASLSLFENDRIEEHHDMEARIHSSHEADDEQTQSHSPQTRKRQKTTHQPETPSTGSTGSTGPLSYLNPLNIFRSSPGPTDRSVVDRDRNTRTDVSPAQEDRSRGGSVLGRLLGWGKGEDKDKSVLPNTGDVLDVEEDHEMVEGEKDLDVELDRTLVVGASAPVGHDDDLEGSARFDDRDQQDEPYIDVHAMEIDEYIDVHAMEIDEVSPGDVREQPINNVPEEAVSHDTESQGGKQDDEQTKQGGEEKNGDRETSNANKSDGAAVLQNDAPILRATSVDLPDQKAADIETAITIVRPSHAKRPKLRGFRPATMPSDGLSEDFVLRMTATVMAARNRNTSHAQASK